jgi:hypothetical protein
VALEASPRYIPRPEPARGWLYGIAWNKLHEAGRHGCSEDTARCNLGMAPIALGNDSIAQIEAVAGASALLQRAVPVPVGLSARGRLEYARND